MKKHVVGLIIATGMTVVSSAADESSITRQQADEILRELHEIRDLLRPPNGAGFGAPAAAPRNVNMRLEKTQFIGSEKAPLTK